MFSKDKVAKTVDKKGPFIDFIFIMQASLGNEKTFRYEESCYHSD